MNHGSNLRDRFKETVRAAILDSAERAFAAAGLTGARMDAIAQGAGVSVGTLYNYFEDRDAIVSALLERHRTEMLVRLETASAGKRRIEDRLLRLVRATLEHYDAHAAFFAVLLAQEPSDRRSTALKELKSRIGAALEGATELRAEHAGLYPALLVGMLRGVVLAAIEKKQRDPLAGTAEAIVTTFLHGASRR